MILTYLYTTWTYLVRILGILLLLFVLSIITLIVAVRFEVVQDRMGQYVSDRVNEAIIGHFSYEKISFTFPIILNLDGVHLMFEKQEESIMDTVFVAKHIELDISFTNLLNRRLRVDRLEIDEPVVNINTYKNSVYTFFKALSSKDQEADSLIVTDSLTQFQLVIYAPIIRLNNGKINVNQLLAKPYWMNLPDRFIVDKLDGELLLEASKRFYFFDIQKLTLESTSIFNGEVEISGQFYGDSSFVELNRFIVNTELSEIDASLSFNGVNAFAPDWFNTITESEIRFDLDRFHFIPSEFADLIPSIPNYPNPIDFVGSVSGNKELIHLTNLEWYILNSSSIVTGTVNHILNPAKMNFSVDVKDMVIEPLDLLSIGFENILLEEISISHLTANAHFVGNQDSVDYKMQLGYSKQSTLLEGRFNAKTGKLNGNVTLNNLNLNRILSKVPVKRVDADVEFSIGSVYERIPDFSVRGRVDQIGMTNGKEIKKIDTDLLFSNRILEYQVSFLFEEAILGLTSKIDFSESDSLFNIRGSFTDLNLNRIPGLEMMTKTDLTGIFELRGRGFDLQTFNAIANIDIKNAQINSTEIEPHQLYADISSPVNNERIFRLTSSIIDLQMSGEIDPTFWYETTLNWWDYLNYNYKENILFDKQNEEFVLKEQTQSKSLKFEVSVKDLTLIHKYWSEFPEIESSLDTDIDIEVNENKIVFVGDANLSKLKLPNYEFSNFALAFTGALNASQPFKESASIVVNLKADSLIFPKFNIENLILNGNLQKDLLVLTIEVNSSIEKARFAFSNKSKFLHDKVLVVFDQLLLGNNQYEWINENEVSGIYHADKRFVLDRLVLKNDEQKLFVDGVYSRELSDSLIFTFIDIEIDEISRLLNSRIRYSGVLNGRIITRSFEDIPDLSGSFNINKFAMGGRMIGDVGFNSIYSKDKSRFLTDFELTLDESNYPEIYRQQGFIANKIRANGFIKPIDNTIDADTLFKMNVDISEVNLWVLKYFIPPIFSQIDGKATGYGTIYQTKEGIDFYSSFDLEHVYAKPLFLETNYYMSGNIIFGYDEGVQFNLVTLKDDQNGTGLLDGWIDLNKLGPNKSYDLTLNLSRLNFLNKPFDAEAPFYGNVSGTGAIRLSGPSSSPFLQTIQPIVTTAESKFSIPLLDETRVETQRRFIEFVESFDLINKSIEVKTEQSSNSTNRTISNVQEKSFTELFQMDLQFSLPQSTTFELVFDPATKEILTARGGGNLTISLEDQDLRMFGRFDVVGGDYMFVGGNVLSKRFDLQSGGTLVWEGEPQNPNINLTAFYRARPNFQPITGQDIRIPVTLVLNLKGTIQSLQNDFYFDIPSTTFQESQPSTALTLLNSEEQKLAQATSLLLTGSFFPIATQAGQEGSGFASAFQNNATELGLSQLLSNQINNLLNSSISNLDIDLNLTGFDQADLGIALRLFDDRLILRREGQLTSNNQTTNQNFVGDLGANFKLSRSLSVEVFYRQDPSLSNYGTIQNQTENVSGIGLQYEVQFNSWREFPKVFWKNISSLFKNEEEDI